VFTEVTKALQARKCEKMKKMQSELGNEKQEQNENFRIHHDKHDEAQRRHSEQVHIMLHCKFYLVSEKNILGICYISMIFPGAFAISYYD
jgi:hypothetical protein